MAIVACGAKASVGEDRSPWRAGVVPSVADNFVQESLIVASGMWGGVQC